MIRHQWKETRTIVNRALSKVIRPLQLRDLFYVNVNGGEHEIFGNKKPTPPPSTKGEEEDVDVDLQIDNLDMTEGSKTVTEKKSMGGQQDIDAQNSIQSLHKSAQSKHSSNFKTPNVVLNDYKFEAEKMVDENPDIHPILGTKEVRNFNEIDWDGLIFAQ